MKTIPAILMILALAAAMALADASCNRGIREQAGTPPAAKDSAKNPDAKSSGKPPAADPCVADPSQCDQPERGELKQKAQQMCALDRDNCQTLRRIRKTIRTHCKSGQALCQKTRPQIKALTNKALDTCIANPDQCAKTLEQLERDAFTAVQIK